MLTEGENLDVFSIFRVDNSAPRLMMTLVGSVLSCRDRVCWPPQWWVITSSNVYSTAQLCRYNTYLDLKLTTALNALETLFLAAKAVQ